MGKFTACDHQPVFLITSSGLLPLHLSSSCQVIYKTSTLCHQPALLSICTSTQLFHLFLCCDLFCVLFVFSCCLTPSSVPFWHTWLCSTLVVVWSFPHKVVDECPSSTEIKIIITMPYKGYFFIHFCSSILIHNPASCLSKTHIHIIM